MKKQVLSTCLAGLTLSVLAAGCGTSQNGTGQGTSGAGAKAIKVGLVTDVGGLNDNGFNHLADVGLNNAQTQLGIQGNVVQSTNASDYVPNLTRFAAAKYDLVIAVGYLMHDAVEQVSQTYPNTKFMIVDDTITDRKNVASAVYSAEEAGYLAGAMAGLLEKGHALPHLNSKNVVGVIGGQSAPPINSYIAGFQQGFKREDPTGQVLLSYTNSFTDQALGNQYAKNQMTQGADIIFPVAGGCGVGAITAAKDANEYAVGVDTNQNFLAPQNVITSAMKGVDTSVLDIIKSVKNKSFHSGIVTFNLKNGGVGIAPAMKGVPASVVTEVNKLKQSIISGQFQISTTVQK